jgi:hypothetical protein
MKKKNSFEVVLFLVSVCSLFSQNKENEYLITGTKKFKNGNYKSAALNFTKAIQWRANRKS